MSTAQRSKRLTPRQSYDESDGDQDQESNPTGSALEDEGDIPPTVVASPKKRKRADEKPTAKRRRNQREGRLEKFKILPVELMLYIFEMLPPKALVAMSRTNREYRNFLIAADSVWKQSRLRIGMPDLTAKDITERQYILLVFDKTCHGTDCYKQHIQDMEWISCARLCVSCRRSTKMTKGKLRKYVASLHPCAQVCAKGPDDLSFYIPRGIVKMSEKLSRMTAQEIIDFVKERRALKACIAQDAKNISDWVNEESAVRHGTDEENRQARIGQIKERLLALGWTEDSLSMTRWHRNLRVTQPRRLSETIWDRIQDPLLQDMCTDLLYRRNDCRREALKPKYQELLESSPTPDVFPPTSVFLDLPSVRRLWQETVDPLPDNVDVANFVLHDDAKWVAALPTIQAEVLTYQQDIEDLAIARLEAAYAVQGLPVPSPADILNDPRSMFCFTPYQRSWRLGPVKEDVILPFPAIHREIRDVAGFYVDDFRRLGEPTMIGDRGLYVRLRL